MLRIVQAIWLALATLILPGCAFVDDSAPDYRYRLTVEVETPKGLRSGSGVIEVEQTLVRPGSSPSHLAVERRVRGEAVAVDLPGNKTLYALLRSEEEPEWSSLVYVLLAPRKSQSFEDSLDDVVDLKGKRTLPRMWPPRSSIPPRSAYPMLVTFNDSSDPSTVVEVKPDDLAASFGDGVRLRRITVELTNDTVTRSIEDRLKWLPHVKGALVHLPMSDYPPVGTPLPLYAALTQSDFLKK